MDGSSLLTEEGTWLARLLVLDLIFLIPSVGSPNARRMYPTVWSR